MSAATERFTPKRLRGGRGTTEALDIEDSAAAYRDMLKVTNDPTSAAILAGFTLVAEAVREAKS